MIIISIIVSAITYEIRENKGTKIPLMLDRYYHLCTQSINTVKYKCNNQYYDMINITEKEIIEIIKECPDGKFIDAKYCIGKSIKVYNPKNYLK